MSVSLPPHEHSVLTALAAAGVETDFSRLVEQTGLDQSLVSAALASLADRAWAAVSEETRHEPVLTDAGREAAEHGTPERRLLLLLDLDHHVLMSDVHKVAAEKGFDGSAAVQWIFRKKWAKKVKGEDGPDRLVLTPEGENALIKPGSPDEVAITRAARGEIAYL